MLPFCERVGSGGFGWDWYFVVDWALLIIFFLSFLALFFACWAFSDGGIWSSNPGG